ncbi:unnamed protein product [Durusdinium trenchii]|uniref:Uncharacterized protein n=1 Tax=Durusdinium trenchii TaxID=1381693 RepID=A0ABP0NDT0_9DINO
MSPDRGEPSPDSPGRGARAHRRGPEPIEPGEVRLLRPRAGQPAPRPAQQWKLSLVPPPAARAGDGQVVYLGLSKLATLDAIRFETPYDKLRQWGARDQSDTPSLEEEAKSDHWLLSHTSWSSSGTGTSSARGAGSRKGTPQGAPSGEPTCRRRSVQALEQLRSDLMSHSTTVPCYRYKGSARVWDAIRENANQQCVKMRRALEAAMAQKKELPNLEEMLANLERQRLPLTPPPEDPERPLYLTCVVLLYVSPCNPLNLENIMMLRRARESVEAFHRVVVPGAVQLPFDFRLEMADAVIQTSEQEWILTDNCQEGCLANAPGKLLDYISEYTRSRLFDPGFDTKVLQVRDEDTLWTRFPRNDGSHRVPFDAYGRVPDVSPFWRVKDVGYLLIECPKQVQCNELLRRAIWLICRKEDTSSAMDLLRRLLGSNAAELLQRWARTRARQSRER